MNVLFLDIDGVLNNDHTREKCGAFTGVDRVLSERLLNWKSVQPSDIQIVLSSAWRKHPEMWEHLHEAGIHWIDITPTLPGARGDEVKQWLSEHPEVEKYAILDDMSDFLQEQFPNFVQTDYRKGLTHENLVRLSSIFN